MGNMREFIITDENGDETFVIYTSNSCSCSLNNCNDDTLDLYEIGDSNPYRLSLPRGELSWFIESLLDGSSKAKEVAPNS